jgi:signal transduction histidine kinase
LRVTNACREVPAAPGEQSVSVERFDEKIIGSQLQLSGAWRDVRSPVRRPSSGSSPEAVNDVAERLAHTAAERTAHTKRLFEVQEEERRVLARDLDDKFGQCLTATLAFAASIEAGASERPDLAEGARSISRVAERMMTSNREAQAPTPASALWFHFVKKSAAPGLVDATSGDRKVCETPVVAAGDEPGRPP